MPSIADVCTAPVTLSFPSIGEEKQGFATPKGLFTAIFGFHSAKVTQPVRVGKKNAHQNSGIAVNQIQSQQNYTP